MNLFDKYYMKMNLMNCKNIIKQYHQPINKRQTFYIDFPQYIHKYQIMSQEQTQTLDSHLNMIKALPEDKIDDQFFSFMNKSKQALGDLHPQMALYYYEYANYILKKIQKNIDIFNPDKMPANAGQAQLDQIEEDYISQEQDQSQQKVKSQHGAEPEEKVQAAPQEKVEYEDGDIVIKGQAGQKKQVQAPKQNTEVQNNEVQQSNQQDDAEEDERQICFYNLQCAIKIFKQQQELMKNGDQTYFPKEKLIDYLIRAHSRLGDLYIINQSYPEGIDEYKKVVQYEHTKPDWQKNRGLAQTHYLIGNAFLYQNKEGCEQIAITQYITSVNLLVAHMKQSISYDGNFEIPSKEKIKVNRLSYLPKPQDSTYVSELKDVISCLLDKIEDTYEQIGVRIALQEEKKKLQKEGQTKQFKELPEGTQVKNLGTFGNRKKAPKQIQNQQPQQNPNSKPV